MNESARPLGIEVQHLRLILAIAEKGSVTARGEMLRRHLAREPGVKTATFVTA